MFYSAAKTRDGERLWPMVRKSAGSGAGRYRTLRGFIKALRRPGERVEIAVVAVADREELQQFLSMRQWLWDLRVILVLPDDDPASVAAGHLLRPRFVIRQGDRLEEIAAVLRRMVEQVNAGEVPVKAGEQG